MSALTAAERDADQVDGGTADVIVCNLFPEPGVQQPGTGTAPAAAADSPAGAPPALDARGSTAPLRQVGGKQRPFPASETQELDSGPAGAAHESGGSSGGGGGNGGDSMAELQRLARELASLCAGTFSAEQPGAESESDFDKGCEHSEPGSPDGSTLGSAESGWRRATSSGGWSGEDRDQREEGGCIIPSLGRSQAAPPSEGEAAKSATLESAPVSESDSGSDSGSDISDSAFASPAGVHIGGSSISSVPSSAFATPAEARLSSSGAASLRHTAGSANEVRAPHRPSFSGLTSSSGWPSMPSCAFLFRSRGLRS